MHKRDHIVPASIVGRFSGIAKEDIGNKGWRNQEVFIWNSSNREVENEITDKIIYEVAEHDSNFTNKNFESPTDEEYYKGVKIDVFDLDKNIFHPVERKMPEIIDFLEDGGHLDKGRYDILISYVAQIIIRSKTARKRIENSLCIDLIAGSGASQEDKYNIIQNSIQAYRECIFKKYRDKYLPKYSMHIIRDFESRFILPDLGIAPVFVLDEQFCVSNPELFLGPGAENRLYRDYLSGSFNLQANIFYCIPLSPKIAILMVLKNENRRKPFKNIQYNDVAGGEVISFDVAITIDDLNSRIAHASRKIYVGPTKYLVQRYSAQEKMSSFAIEKFLFMDFDKDPEKCPASLWIIDEKGKRHEGNIGNLIKYGFGDVPVLRSKIMKFHGLLCGLISKYQSKP